LVSLYPEDAASLNQELLNKMFSDLGLTQSDYQVYVFLTKHGPQKGKNLCDELKIRKQQLYRSLRNLQGKGLASASCERPAQYAAILLERVIDMFIKVKTEEAKALQETREDLLSAWRSIIKKETS
jgi:sugar-specific transcriptional regulator TrmB